MTLRQAGCGLAAAALLAGLLAASPAFAEPTPAYAVKTKTVELAVTIEPAIKADSTLAANLLAEGRRWADQNRSETDAERRKSPELYRNEQAWSFERRYAIESIIANRYVGIVRSDSTYTGGAHPNADVDTILWDRKVGKRISIRPFFTETADDGPTLRAMYDQVVAAIKAEKKARDIDDNPEMDWYKNIEPGLLKIGAIGLAASTEPGRSAGLIFHYPPYVVGPYAEGEYDVFIPWEGLKPFLSAEGTTIFGGRRPDAGKADR